MLDLAGRLVGAACLLAPPSLGRSRGMLELLGTLPGQEEGGLTGAEGTGAAATAAAAIAGVRSTGEGSIQGCGSFCTS